MDGISLVPVLAGESLNVDRPLFFAHVQGRGVRRGPWKASKRDGRGWELFNLDADPGETRDLSGKEPEMLNSLVQQLGNWGRHIRQERQGRLAASTTPDPPASDAVAE